MFIDSVNASFDHCNVSLSETVCQITSKDISFDLIEEDSNRSIISIHSPDLVSITIYYNSDTDNVAKITPHTNCKNIKTRYSEGYKEIDIESKNCDKYRIVNGYSSSLSEFKFFVMKDGDWVWLASIIVNIK